MRGNHYSRNPAFHSYTSSILVLGGGKLWDSLHNPKEKALLKPIQHSQLAKEPKTWENLWSKEKAFPLSPFSAFPFPAPMWKTLIAGCFSWISKWLLWLVAQIDIWRQFFVWFSSVMKISISKYHGLVFLVFMLKTDPNRTKPVRSGLY